MSEHTPLTEAEYESLDEEFGDAFTVAWADAINRILAARTSTATADTGLRERVALSEETIDNIAAFVRTFDSTEQAARALPVLLRVVQADATPASTEDRADNGGTR